MPSLDDKKKSNLQGWLDIMLCCGILFLIGSCTVQINDSSDHQNALHLFLLHWVVLFPVLFAFVVYCHYKLDKADFSEKDAMIARANARTQLNVLVNNAGVLGPILRFIFKLFETKRLKKQDEKGYSEE